MISGDLRIRVNGLVKEVSENNRTALKHALNDIEMGNATGAILGLATQALKFMKEFHAACGTKKRYDSLHESITDASEMPAVIRTNMHKIKSYGNAVRHDIEGSEMGVQDAEDVLRCLIKAIEWFYCKFDRGPRLASTYTPEVDDIISAEKERVILQYREYTSDMPGDRIQVPLPLPSPTDSFIGRDDQRDRLAEHINDRSTRAIVIVGPGGFGKTALVANALKDIFPDGVRSTDPRIEGALYIRCYDEDIPLERILFGLGRVIGKQEELKNIINSPVHSIEDKLDYAISEINRLGTILVILDNVENLLDLENGEFLHPRFKRFIDHVKSIRNRLKLILVTRVMPQGFADPATGIIEIQEGLTEEQAVKFLKDRGESIRIGSIDEGLLKRLANRYFRVPKALEAIIGFIHNRYPGGKSEDIQSSDELFGEIDEHDIENGIKSILARQLIGLTADLIIALFVMSIFRGQVTAHALEYMLPFFEWVDVLDRLKRNYLIVPSYKGQYDIHPLIREIVLEITKSDGSGREGLYYTENGGVDVKMSEKYIDTIFEGIEPEEYEQRSVEVPFVFSSQELHARAARYFSEIREALGEDNKDDNLELMLEEIYHLLLSGKDEKILRAMRYIEHDSLTGDGRGNENIEFNVTDYVCDIADTRLTDSLLGGYAIDYMDINRAHDAVPCLRLAIEIAKRRDRKNDMWSYQNGLGIAYFDLEEYEAAIEAFNLGIEIARDLDSLDDEMDSLTNLCVTYYQKGDTRSMGASLKRAIRITKNDLPMKISILSRVAVACMENQDYRRSVGYLLKAKRLCEDLEDKALKMEIILGLAASLYNMMRFEDSLRNLKEALTLSREVGDENGEAVCLRSMAIVYGEMGQQRVALVCLEEAMALCVKNGNKELEALVATDLFPLYSEERRWGDAMVLLERALLYSRELGDKHGEGRALMNLGACEFAIGNTREARSKLEDALDIWNVVVDRELEAMALLTLGNLLEAIGDIEGSRGYLERALEIYGLLDDVETRLLILRDLVSIYSSSDQWDEFRRCHGLILEIFGQLKDKKSEGEELLKTGEYFLKKQDIAVSILYFEKALESLVSPDIRPLRMAALLYLCAAYLQIREYDLSIERGEWALPIAQELRDRQAEASTHRLLGSAYYSIGKKREASKHLNEALRIYEELKDVENIGDVKRLIESVNQDEA